MTQAQSPRLTLEILEHDDLTVIVVVGTFNRRIALPEFEKAVRDLGRCATCKKLVVDLSDVAAIDSKGEGELENLIADVVSGSGRASVVVDSARRYLYVGLEELIRALGNQASVVFSRDEATSFVRGAE